MRWPSLVRGFAASTQVSAAIEAGGFDEDGAPVEAATWSGKANWQDTARRVFQTDRGEDVATATLYIDGDALPDVARIAGGTVSALGLEWRIVAGTRARNPDGTVNYTRLELA